MRAPLRRTYLLIFYFSVIFIFCDAVQDDNMNIQVGATFAMMAILFCWFGYWFYEGLTINPSSIPAIGSDMSTVLGVVLFNYTCACVCLTCITYFHSFHSVCCVHFIFTSVLTWVL